MPYNSFQKLSTSKLSGLDSLIPATPIIVSGVSGASTRVGFRRARFGLAPSGANKSNYSKVGIYRSTDGGSNYSFISGWNLAVSGGAVNIYDTGLATGITYTYKFRFSGLNGGASYETESTGFTVTTKVHIEATGGDYKIADTSSYLSTQAFGYAQYHVFRKSANFALQCTGSPDEKIHFLLVGGGGGGGQSRGGGGGAGGISHITGIKINTTGNYAVTIGAGGAEVNGGGNSNGNRGGSSSFLNYTGYGGGGGGGQNQVGLSGGCGGGPGSNGVTGGSGFSGVNATGLVYGWSLTPTGIWFKNYDHQGRKGNTDYDGGGAEYAGGGGASFAFGANTNRNSTATMDGQQGWPTSYFNGTNSYSHPSGGTTYPVYGWVATALSGNGSYIAAGGGAGGAGFRGGGGNFGGGQGNLDYGENYYSYPAGLGGSGTWYGAGGGGGGQGGGGGGAGYSGLVIIGYFTGDNMI